MTAWSERPLTKDADFDWSSVSHNPACWSAQRVSWAVITQDMFSAAGKALIIVFSKHLCRPQAENVHLWAGKHLTSPQLFVCWPITRTDRGVLVAVQQWPEGKEAERSKKQNKGEKDCTSVRQYILPLHRKLFNRDAYIQKIQSYPGTMKNQFRTS